MGGSIPTRGESGVWGLAWKNRWDYPYVLPAILAVALVMLYPLVQVVYLSFFRTSLYSPIPRFDGLGNYWRLLTSDKFWTVLTNTLEWTVGATALGFVWGLIAALVLNQEIPGRTALRNILLLPYVISYVVAGYLWVWIFHGQFGLANSLLRQVGLIHEPIQFLENTRLVMSTLIFTQAWKTAPFVMIMLTAGLQTIPPQIYAAARVDGANRWQQFREITWPHLIPFTTLTITLQTLSNFHSFTLPWIMTGGGPMFRTHIFATYIYLVSFNELNFGLASTAAVVVAAVASVAGIFYVRSVIRVQKGEA
jgi:multiple sugar transport system permease protein